MDRINRYFPYLTDEQKSRFEALYPLYSKWNAEINVISRKDIDNLYLRHVLHSLSIAKIIGFKPNTNIIDIGTGGGFPGIPLAILFPDSHFCLLDSVGKKIKVALEIANALELKNCSFANKRMEEEKGKYEFAISRAAMTLDDLVRLSKKNISKEQKNVLPNGIICLKGGDIQQEVQPYKKLVNIFEIGDLFEEDFFETKKAIYLPIH